MKPRTVSTLFLKEGDVIMSEDFAYCSRDSRGLHFNWKMKASILERHPVGRLMKYFDKKRAKRKYIVTHKDSTANYLNITVKCLKKNDVYNPNGEEIAFSPDEDTIHFLDRVKLVARYRIERRVKIVLRK